ncbi:MULTISPECIES: hypothetical protein [unclassified Streptomyces]|uniref:hypothetical protein n=1 Tax=unclassified Streptomyces TaxID=2593676 RepID=UPI0028C46018|nr:MULTISPECIES: hypothetical protein [unclassified Streptomyces]WNO74204.1 hypothetical protein RPQ07_22440 [Streptomyces sp. AM8-1-1]
MDDAIEAARAHQRATVYEELVDIATRLQLIVRLKNGVDPHVGSALHAVRFAVTMLWPTLPESSPPGYRHDSEDLLALAAQWREAALEIGEFAVEPPALRLVGDTTPPA